MKLHCLPRRRLVSGSNCWRRQGLNRLGTHDTLRLEVGMNLYGQEMDEGISPMAANMGWTISWEPADRDFIGHEVLQAQRENGTEKLVELIMTEKKGGGAA